MVQVAAAMGGRGNRKPAERAAGAVSLGRAHLSAHRWHEASQAFTRALHLDQACPGAARGLGHAYTGAGEAELAVSAYRMALRLEPNDAELLNSLGAALFETDDLDGAGRCHRLAMAKRPDYPDCSELVHLLPRPGRQLTIPLRPVLALSQQSR